MIDDWFDRAQPGLTHSSVLANNVALPMTATMPLRSIWLCARSRISVSAGGGHQDVVEVAGVVA